ncbi:serine/threonine kinase [Aureococcus anophagefferens]|nr:serine/threonine kinase [Aureococcus anophagefferens]
MASSIRSDGLQLGAGKFSEVSPESDLRGAAAPRAAGQMPLQYDLTVGDLVVAATAWKGVMVGDRGVVVEPGEDLPYKRCRIKFDDGKGTYVYTKGQQARRVPILGGYDALLVRFPNGVDAEISAGRARPASVVVVPGAPPIFKGDVVLALVDYETVTVGDRGVVVGPCCDPAMSRPDLRVLVDFENKAAYNFRSDAHLRLAPLVEGTNFVRGDKVILPGLDKKVIGVVIGVGRCAGTLAVKGYDALPRDVALARLKHAPLVAGAPHFAKGTRVVAKVAYNEVRVGDRGVVVGPCMQPEMQNAAKRVLVDFGRKGVYNFHVDKQLTCVHGDEDARARGARLRSPAFAKARAAAIDDARAPVAVDVVMPGILSGRRCTRAKGAAPDAGLIISGGYAGRMDGSETWLLSEEEGAARRCATMPGDRTTSSGFAWLGEELVVIGGQSRKWQSLHPYERPLDTRADEVAEVWAYHPGRDAWRELAPLPIYGGLGDMACGVLKDGRLIVCGGAGSTPDYDGCVIPVDQATAYDADSDTWTKIENMPGGERYGMASVVHDGKLFVFGGRYEDNERSNRLCIYDGKTWKRGQQAPFGGSHQHGVIFDGKFYLLGGYWDTGDEDEDEDGNFLGLSAERAAPSSAPSTMASLCLRPCSSYEPGAEPLPPADEPAAEPPPPPKQLTGAAALLETLDKFKAANGGVDDSYYAAMRSALEELEIEEREEQGS